MGARELLASLVDKGLSVTADGDRLVIRPGSKLTDAMRTALHAAKPELLALLAATGATAPTSAPLRDRPYKLAPAKADSAHAQPWDDAACARFVARVTLFLRRDVAAEDADDMAEQLHLRDVEGDERVMCLECLHHRPSRCGNHKAAGLGSPDVGSDLAALLQHCPGFRGAGA